MNVIMAGATHRGRVRKSNQDSIYFDGPLGIAMIADGIGGRKGGAVASSMAIGLLRSAILETDMIRHDEIRPFLVSTIDKVNLAINSRGENDPSYAGMGTTLDCLLFVGHKLYIAHIGDSRTYLYFRKHFWQLTVDHNIKSFLQRGWIAKERLEKNFKQEALVRALGLSSQCDVDVYHKKILPGEIYLMATDGLFDMVPDQEIYKILEKYSDHLRDLPEVLIRTAIKRGGRDNVTVLAAKVLDQA